MKYQWATGMLLIFSLNAQALPEKNIYTEITINAPVERVWAELMNNRAYPEWNPYHVRVDGELKQGNKLSLEIHKPNGAVVNIEPYVIRISPLQELTWGGGIKGIFHGEHVFRLDADTTRLIHKERFHGLVIPFASLDAIEAGYQQMNQALKRRVEGTPGL